MWISINKEGSNHYRVEIDSITCIIINYTPYCRNCLLFATKPSIRFNQTSFSLCLSFALSLLLSTRILSLLLLSFSLNFKHNKLLIKLLFGNGKKFLETKKIKQVLRIFSFSNGYTKQEFYLIPKNTEKKNLNNFKPTCFMTFPCLFTLLFFFFIFIF